MSDDSKKIVRVLLRLAKMAVKLLEELLEEK